MTVCGGSGGVKERISDLFDDTRSVARPDVDVGVGLLLPLVLLSFTGREFPSGLPCTLMPVVSTSLTLNHLPARREGGPFRTL